MHCPFCQFEDTRVIDSRVSEDGNTIRRRRECEHCGERFNTFETVEIKLAAIVKSDGRRVFSTWPSKQARSILKSLGTYCYHVQADRTCFPLKSC